MGTLTVVHTNKLYLPHKWVRVPPAPREDATGSDECQMIVNPDLFEYDGYTALSELEMRQLIALWADHGEDGSIVLSTEKLDVVKMLELGLLSTVQGL